MAKYCVKTQKQISEEYGEYTSYGLEFTKENGEKSVVSDLSANKKQVVKFCRLLNKYDVNAENLNDYIEDFLTDEDFYL